MADEDSPLIKALPPESDYYTYLTIVEYNLSQENLPILHKVLQDEALTTNIGWDLVHLLVPYLPESQQCLHDIARLGNPREVILKVTEGLRLIEYETAEDADDDEEHAEAGASDVRARAESSTYPLKTAPVPEGESRPGSGQAVELPPPLPLAVNQFVSLLSMLSVLHGRIRTKNPSRFLSTTLQAILASFSNSASHREEMIRSIVTTIKAITGTKRPTLPNRQSSGMLGTSGVSTTGAVSASDPEATESSDLTFEEQAMQTRLLQSFITHIMEEYMLNLQPTKDDVPGMAWCSRIIEKLHPERIIPQSKTLAHRFASEESLHRRIDAIGQLVTLAQDLKIADEDLLHAAITVERVPDRDGQDEDEPPDSAEEIPLSRLGSLMLYAARQVVSVLYDAPVSTTTPPFAIFPDHHELVKNCLSAPNQGTGTIGSEPEALIDAVTSLGLLALENDMIGEPSTDEQFNEYLQTIALLSSNCPSPNLRGHAHYLATTILCSHPDEEARLAFIRDTLEHCPFENLKVSAVSWIKGETIEANPPTPIPGHSQKTQPPISETSIFAKPLALDTLSPFLFPSLQADLITSPVRDSWMKFRSNLPIYLASLNFLYLLLCAKHLHERLMIHDLWTNNDVAGSFIQPLREGSERFKKEMHGGGELSEERRDEVLAEMNVLDDALQRVEASVRFLNE
jgi:hypothetical protein